MTRTRRSSLNYLSHTCLTVVTVVVSLVATPWFLRWLGQERLGAFRAASDWLGYLTLLELGLGGALLPLVAAARAPAGDGTKRVPGRLEAVMSAAFRAYRRVGLAMLVGGAVLALLIPRLVQSGDAAVRGDLSSGIWLGLAVVLFVPFAPLRYVWEADQRAYTVNWLLLIQSLVITTAALVLAWRGWGVTGQLGAMAIGAAVFNLGLLAFSRRRYPEAVGAMFSGDRTADSALWRLNWPTFALGVSGRVSLMTDNIVIALVLGPAAVVPFFLTQRLAQLAQGQLQAVGNSTWAGFVHLRAEHGNEEFIRRLLEVTQLIVVLGACTLVPIVAFNRQFVGLWVGDPQFAGHWLTCLTACNALMLAVLSFWGWMFTGTGQVARLTRPLLVSAAVNVAVSVGATLVLRNIRPDLALLGPALGTTVAFTLVNSWWTAGLLRRCFGVNPRALTLSVLRPIAVALPAGVAAVWWSHARPHMGWAEWILSSGGMTAFLLGICWVVVLSRRERLTWQTRLNLLRSAQRGMPEGQRLDAPARGRP